MLTVATINVTITKVGWLVKV